MTQPITLDGTHPSGPAGPRPSGPPPPPVPLPKATAPDPPLPPPPPPGPPRPAATGDPDPRPRPWPPPPKHLVDHGFRVEVWSRDSHLLAVAEVRTAGLWWMQTAGHEAYYIGGREQATSAMRELAVAS